MVLLLVLVWLVWKLAVDHGRRKERAVLESSLRRPSAPRGVRGMVLCEHGNWAYWRLEGELMRAPLVGGRAELRYAHAVDVLECDELSPADAIAVIDALDEAEARYGTA